MKSASCQKILTHLSESWHSRFTRHPVSTQTNGEDMRLRIFASARGGAGYGEIARLAQHAEQCGFDGFFHPDHFISVAGPSSKNPTDVWTLLAGLARDTQRIRLGSMV